ncbi:MAG TPA: sporulation protein YabP [Candidatus Galloscillospira stercoripullorum]|nr:sporulation protein YabP [Candidatus Galloscillospira stercoripullorum]
MKGREKDMAMEEKRFPGSAPHHLILEERENLSVSGVVEVRSFDENTIVMETSRGVLVVQGEDLHIEKLSLDGGDLKVEGEIDSLTYEEGGRGKGGFLSRLLG